MAIGISVLLDRGRGKAKRVQDERMEGLRDDMLANNDNLLKLAGIHVPRVFSDCSNRFIDELVL